MFTSAEGKVEYAKRWYTHRAFAHIVTNDWLDQFGMTLDDFEEEKASALRRRDETTEEMKRTQLAQVKAKAAETRPNPPPVFETAAEATAKGDPWTVSWAAENAAEDHRTIVTDPEPYGAGADDTPCNGRATWMAAGCPGATVKRRAKDYGK